MLLVTVGAMLGRVLRARQRLLAPTTVAAAVVCVLACTGLAIPLAHLEGEMEVRAQRWDRQDQWLRTHAAHGDQVLPYTPVSVSGLGEPFGQHGQKPWPLPSASPSGTTSSASPTHPGFPDGPRALSRCWTGVSDGVSGHGGLADRVCVQAVVGRPTAPVIWSQMARRMVVSPRSSRWCLQRSTERATPLGEPVPASVNAFVFRTFAS